MRDGAPMVRLFLIVAILQLAALLSGFPSQTANAGGACGCTSPWTTRWTCYSGSCPIVSCRDTPQTYPDMASCRKRSVVPAQSAKTTEPKVVKSTPPKKQAVKLAQKPNSSKTTSLKKESARLEPEQEPAAPAETSIAKQDRNVDPQAPVAMANLSPAPSVATPTSVDKQALGRRVALVIGNSAYAAVPALKNPPMDARAIADTLTKLGFEKVTLKLDLDRQSLWTALSEFARESSRADWAVIYFAGHGIEVDGQNYLIPTDATLESDNQVLFETVPLDNVVEATAGARKFRLVILDACRNNPFLASMTRVASSRSIGRGLSRVEPQGGVLVAYAAKAGQIALDGDEGNSPFVRALVEQLDRPGVEVGFLFRKVRDSVLKQTAGAQEPYIYGSLPGDEELFFKPPAI